MQQEPTTVPHARSPDPSLYTPGAATETTNAARIRFSGGPPAAGRAFTLVELMVVVVIITILIGSVMIAATTLVNRAKASNTRAMLTVVQQAVDEFKREQTVRATIARDRFYKKRYGPYPPDELEVFTPIGVPGANNAKTLAPSGAVIFPEPDGGGAYPPMKFYTKGLPIKERILEHRDQVAMTLAIELFGDASSALLDQVQDKFWRDVPRDKQDDPVLFLDRPSGGKGKKEKWDPGDLAIRYLVDDWGNPISYLAQRDHVDENTPASSNHPDWNDAVTEMVRINGGRPILLSYGPDGDEQLTQEMMGADALATLFVDFEETTGDERERVTNPLNADNIYADPTLKEKLSKGVAE